MEKNIKAENGEIVTQKKKKHFAAFFEFLKKHMLTRSDPEYYKKMYKRQRTEFLVVLAVFGAVIYFNYDYLLFKYVMCQKYVYADTLKDVYNKELETEESGNIYADFDDLAIKLTSQRITEENGDRYTFLYLKGKYKEKIEDMNKKGANSKFDMIDEKTGYMLITNFSSKSYDIFKENIDNMKNCDNLILDLRDNYGGYVSYTRKIADEFLNKGDIICSEKARGWLYSGVTRAKTKKDIEPKHIYILQNGFTASSSEIFVNALRENLDNVTIVGTTSYGKGIGQGEYRLKNGYAARVTIVELLTPKGNSIHKKGITPDVKCENEDPKKFVLEELID